MSGFVAWVFPGVLALAVVACGGSGSGGGGGATGTGATGGGATGATGGGATGATGGGGTGATGGGGAAGAGGGGTATSVEVRYYGGKAAAGVDLVVHGADGSAASQAKTGADGKASVEVPSGGGVSIVWREPGTGGVPRTAIESVFGIEPGATISRAIGVPIGSEAPMTIKVGGSSSLAGLYALASCWATPDSLSTAKSYAYRPCPGQSEFDFVFLDLAGQTLDYLAQVHDPKTELTLATASTAFKPASWNIEISFDVASSIPAGTALGFLRTTNLDGRYMVTRGLVGMGQKLTIPRGPGSSTDYYLEARLVQTGKGVSHRAKYQSLPTKATFAVPAIAPVETVSPSVGQVAYALGSGSDGDAVVVELRWEDGNEETRWYMTGPVQKSATLEWPEIPGGLAGAAPTTAPKFALAYHRDVLSESGVAAAFSAVGAGQGEVAETIRTWP